MSPRLILVCDVEPPFTLCANLVQDRVDTEEGPHTLQYLETGTPTLCPMGRHVVDNVQYGWGGAVLETQQGVFAFVGPEQRVWVEG